MECFLQSERDWQKLVGQLIQTAKRAGKIQLEIYATDFDVDYKQDDSPVSQADIASEKIILDDLADIAPHIPVLAEEAASRGETPKLGNCFFCVDPLDGTKEFINKNDEFTVNIALIENGTPVFGLVYAPALRQLFVTISPTNAVRSIMGVDDPDKSLEEMDLKPIKTRIKPAQEGLSVVASRSHMSPETGDYLKSFNVAKLKSAGSSLKLCMVASGEADLYPRLAPTMEWDTAAGHAIVLAAGGSVITEDGAALKYHKKDQKRPFLNPSFIVQAAHLTEQALPHRIPCVLLGKPSKDSRNYANKIRQNCSLLATAPLVIAQERILRLEETVKQRADTVLILASQYDGLTHWMRQDIIMASALGVQQIIIALYHMEDEDDPTTRLEAISVEIQFFVEGANLTASFSCDVFDIEARQEIYTFLDNLGGAVEPLIDQPNQTSDQFGVWLAWYGKKPMLPGRPYRLKLAGQEVIATITALKYCLDPITGAEDAAKTILPGRIAFCNISLSKCVGFEPFDEHKGWGQFTLSNKGNGNNIAWGRIAFSLARATNLRWQPLAIDKRARAAQKEQKPFVLWFTGLSGCGKSTIASLLEKKLLESQKHTYVLDGDNVRHGLCRDLGFVDVDRVENMRRVSETAKLFVDAGLIVMVSFISPFDAERKMARSLFEKGEFFEIFVDTPLEICEARDIKGLYKKARAGKVPNFTGISSPFETPKNADIYLDGCKDSAEEMTNILYGQLVSKGLV